MKDLRKSILVDSSFLIAFYNPLDSQHAKTLRYVKDWDSGSIHFVITQYVFIETVTVLSLRAGRVISIMAGENMMEHKNLTILEQDQPAHSKAWEVFKSLEKKNMSFIDCSILATLQAESIGSLLTFDETDFKPLQKKYGFHLYKT